MGISIHVPIYNNGTCIRFCASFLNRYGCEYNKMIPISAGYVSTGTSILTSLLVCFKNMV